MQGITLEQNEGARLSAILNYVKTIQKFYMAKREIEDEINATPLSY